MFCISMDGCSTPLQMTVCTPVVRFLAVRYILISERVRPVFGTPPFSVKRATTEILLIGLFYHPIAIQPTGHQNSLDAGVRIWSRGLKQHQENRLQFPYIYCISLK